MWLTPDVVMLKFINLAIGKNVQCVCSGNQLYNSKYMKQIDSGAQNQQDGFTKRREINFFALIDGFSECTK